MDPLNPRRYVPAPPPAARVESQKRLQLRIELAKPSEFSKESESEIINLLRRTRAPFPGAGGEAVEAEALALENSLRAFQRELAAQERALREKELHLAEAEGAIIRRAAELAESRLLVEKQRAVFESKLNPTGEGAASSSGLSEESLLAMKDLQSKLDEQTRSIDESKDWLQEREAFLEQSQKTLFQKMQTQQERETEMDQKAENLKGLEKKLTALAEKLRAAGESV